MAQIVDLNYLKAFLNHEIKELTRIKQSLNLEEHVTAVDNLALAWVPVKKSNPEDIARAIKDALRDSDIIFIGGDFLLLMLPGTDEMGAIHVLEGISEFLGEGVKTFMYVIYPRDGQTADELINTLKERVKGEFGIELKLK